MLRSKYKRPILDEVHFVLSCRGFFPTSSLVLRFDKKFNGEKTPNVCVFQVFYSFPAKTYYFRKSSYFSTRFPRLFDYHELHGPFINREKYKLILKMRTRCHISLGAILHHIVNHYEYTQENRFELFPP